MGYDVVLQLEFGITASASRLEFQSPLPGKLYNLSAKPTITAIISLYRNSVFRERIVQTNDEADAEERLEMRCLCGQQISRQQNRKQSEYQSVPTLEYEYSVRKMSIYR